MDWIAFTYSGYLLLALAGTLALQSAFRIRLDWRAASIAIALSGLFFLLWDVWAVAEGHWFFGLESMLGAMIGNQPIEEIAFFIVIPLFGITVWEFFGRESKAKRRLRDD
ncbi:MAG: lycopene cyclase domain-containing protein [Candidatus Iainarchaeum archaeon]|uniref:Lycopene cyclase domain-containing protein n=1 Tax=Candidatus Iainarchaeum sp. TaxID=3101447 RepID=A0A7T9DKD8_9ARCH|nr:MAG: lycopene cyclase domain-containing protein [Candidatus Diapherotrites archaeon]